MDIYINKKKIKLSPQKVIGKGGEADIFDLGKGKAVKIFKPPTHPDYQGLPFAQKAAEERLQEHQTKLRQFPHNLPPTVVTPEELATDNTGNTILGYTMPLLQGTFTLFKYSDRNFRTSSGINNQTVIELFQNLYETISKLHQLKVIIGDFNSLNVLTSDTKAYLIDADSFQYGNFLCQVFTPRFVDPLLCDPHGIQPILIQSHNTNSDWYAFSIMLIQSLLFVEPYGGVYKPKNNQNRIPHTARPLKRITIFHPEVIYPKPALPYAILSDDLLHHFHRCFEQDERGVFPRQLLDNLHWKKCPHCGLEYARLTCPNCAHISVSLTPPPTVTVRGTVTAIEIFKTQGVILKVVSVGDRVNWLYYDQGEFKRENEQVIFTGNLDPKLSFWLHKKTTLVGKLGQVMIFNPDTGVSTLATDCYQDYPMVNCNQLGWYWLHQGQLLREGKLGPEYIGDVLQRQTQFWVGSRFGFGFYRAGTLNVAFVFDIHKRGINDQVKIPYFSGELIEATCTFSDIYCWFFVAVQEQGKIIHRVYVIRADGEIIATSEAEKGDQSWLSNIWGKCAIGNFILAATDEGVVRVEPLAGQIVKTKEFPDTEPWIDSNCYLYAVLQGLCVLRQNKIVQLQLN